MLSDDIGYLLIVHNSKSAVRTKGSQALITQFLSGCLASVVHNTPDLNSQPVMQSCG